MRKQLRPLTDALIQRCMGMGPWEHDGKPLWHRLLDFAMDAGKHGGFPLHTFPAQGSALPSSRMQKVSAQICPIDGCLDLWLRLPSECNVSSIHE